MNEDDTENPDTSSPRLAVGTVFYLGPWSMMRRDQLDADDPSVVLLRVELDWPGKGVLRHPLSEAMDAPSRVAVVLEEDAPAKPFPAPDAGTMFKALVQGRDIFVEYLSSYEVPHRVVRAGADRRPCAVRFESAGEHWTATFHDNGKFEQLAWT